jgi:outer membrane protein OmpA-like peptidoglycan-associated protein
MSSILDLCRAPFTSDALRRVSGALDEGPAVIDKAVAGAAPAILIGVLDTASTPAGMDRVRAMIRDTRSLGAMLDNPGSLLRDRSATEEVMRRGLRVVSTLFGNRADGITEALAGYAGMRSGAASSLLSLVAPIILSLLDRRAGAAGLDFSGVMGLLRAQRSTIAGAVPTGLATALGFRDERSGQGTDARSAQRGRPVRAGRAARPRERRPATPRLWPFLVAGAGVLALLAVLGRPRTLEVATGPASVQQARTTHAVAAPSVGPASEPAAQWPAASVKESPPPTSDAPDTVQQIAVFLAGDSSVEVPRRFVLGDLSFQSGSATLTQESQETVDALAKVLRANPTVEIALEGHTDNTGSAAANKALSTARAAAIEDGLVGAGVPGQRIMVAGYGPDRPVASNDTEEGRARNRRTEVVVVNR